MLVTACRREYIAPIASRGQTKGETVKSQTSQCNSETPGGINAPHTTLTSHGSKTTVSIGCRSVFRTHLSLPVYGTTPHLNYKIYRKDVTSCSNLDSPESLTHNKSTLNIQLVLTFSRIQTHRHLQPFSKLASHSAIN